MPRGTPTTQPNTERTPLTDAEKAERRAASNYVGEVGQEWEGDVRVNFISNPVASAFGNGDRYVFLLGDEDRNAIRLWNNGLTFKQPNGVKGVLTVGDRVRIRATVKSQTEYKGEKQTELSKPVIVGVA
jgi:hypothetical protein